MDHPGNLLAVPDKSPDYEVWAVRRTVDGRKSGIMVAKLPSFLRARGYVRENLPEVVAFLRVAGWLSVNDLDPDIDFEVVNPGRTGMTCVPITRHPAVDFDSPRRPNPIYYRPDHFTTLKDPIRYETAMVGREHFLVGSPTGTYSVDLEPNSGAGLCTCEDFACRRSPRRVGAETKVAPDGQIMALHEDCVHLRHVKFLLDRPFGGKTWIPLAALLQEKV